MHNGETFPSRKFSCVVCSYFRKHFEPKSPERSCSVHHENTKHGIYDIHHKYDLYAQLRAFSHPTFTQLPTYKCYINCLWYSSDTGNPIMDKLGQGGGVGEDGILLCENLKHTIFYFTYPHFFPGQA